MTPPWASPNFRACFSSHFMPRSSGLPWGPKPGKCALAMNAIRASEVIATAWPPWPLLSQEPSFFWTDNR